MWCTCGTRTINWNRIETKSWMVNITFTIDSVVICMIYFKLIYYLILLSFIEIESRWWNFWNREIISIKNSWKKPRSFIWTCWNWIVWQISWSSRNYIPIIINCIIVIIIFTLECSILIFINSCLEHFRSHRKSHTIWFNKRTENSKICVELVQNQTIEASEADKKCHWSNSFHSIRWWWWRRR